MPTDKAYSQEEVVDTRKVGILYDWLKVSSFFQKSTNRILIFIGVSAAVQHTVASLFDTGAVSSLVNIWVLPPSCYPNFKPVKPPSLETGTRQAGSVEGHISLHIFVEDLDARPLFRIFENLEVNLLLWTFVLRSVYPWPLPTCNRVVPIHSHVMTILTSLQKLLSLLVEKNMGDHAYAASSGNETEFSLRIARRETEPPPSSAPSQ